jgi:23S rRNA (adenine2030-N6)-methyltransferase
MIRGGEDETRLNGAGLVAVNAPFTLAANLERLLPELTRVLGQGKGAGFRIEELGSENAKGNVGRA